VNVKAGLVLLVGLCACGDGVERDVVSWCAVDGLLEVTSAAELDCDAFRANFAMTRRVLDAHGLVPTKDSEDGFRLLRVHVVNERYLKVGSEFREGNYNQLSGVLLGRTTAFLAHELLHVWDAAHFALGTIGHEGWDRNGYYAAAEEAAALTVPVLPPWSPSP